MTWNGAHRAVHIIDKVYQRGVKLTKEAMKIREERIGRSGNPPKWDVTIEPAFWEVIYWGLLWCFYMPQSPGDGGAAIDL